MFGFGKKQVAGDGALAVQSSGNVTIINNLGKSESEIREMCEQFVSENFPKLRQEARIAAEEAARNFGERIISQVSENFDNIVLEKLRHPDVQATINDAVLATARRGENASPNILSKLIVERLSKNTTSFTDIVLSEAVKVVPLLTPEQIAYISFVHFVQSVKFTVVYFSSLETIAKNVEQVISSGYNLSIAQQRHIEYTGACSIINIVSSDHFESQLNSYREFGIENGDEFKDKLDRQAPTLKKILVQANLDNLSRCSLTSVGQAIAITNLSQKLGKMDYSIWLK
jgi:hypothetical protein